MSTVRPFLVQVFSWTVLLAVIAAAVVLIILPKATGARPLTVLSGSMTGTFDIGDVVVVRPVDTADLRVGEVITFQPVSDDPALTTHRIVAVNVGSEGTSYVTRGDANTTDDLDAVRPEQVKGAVWYSVPLLGWLSVWMAGWLGVVTDLVAVGLLLYGGWFLTAGVVERRRRPEEVVA